MDVQIVEKELTNKQLLKRIKDVDKLYQMIKKLEMKNVITLREKNVIESNNTALIIKNRQLNEDVEYFTKNKDKLKQLDEERYHILQAEHNDKINTLSLQYQKAHKEIQKLTEENEKLKNVNHRQPKIKRTIKRDVKKSSQDWECKYKEIEKAFKDKQIECGILKDKIDSICESKQAEMLDLKSEVYGLKMQLQEAEKAMVELSDLKLKLDDSEKANALLKNKLQLPQEELAKGFDVQMLDGINQDLLDMSIFNGADLIEQSAFESSGFQLDLIKDIDKDKDDRLEIEWLKTEHVKEVNGLNNEIDTLKKRIYILENDIDKDKDDRLEIERIKTEHVKEVNGLNSEIDTLKKRIYILENDIDKDKDDRLEIERLKTEHVKEVNGLNSEIDTLKRRISILENDSYFQDLKLELVKTTGKCYNMSSKDAETLKSTAYLPLSSAVELGIEDKNNKARDFFESIVQMFQRQENKLNSLVFRINEKFENNSNEENIKKIVPERCDENVLIEADCISDAYIYEILGEMKIAELIRPLFDKRTKFRRKAILRKRCLRFKKARRKKIMLLQTNKTIHDSEKNDGSNSEMIDVLYEKPQWSVDSGCPLSKSTCSSDVEEEDLVTSRNFETLFGIESECGETIGNFIRKKRKFVDRKGRTQNKRLLIDTNADSGIENAQSAVSACIPRSLQVAKENKTNSDIDLLISKKQQFFISNNSLHEELSVSHKSFSNNTIEEINENVDCSLVDNAQQLCSTKKKMKSTPKPKQKLNKSIRKSISSRLLKIRKICHKHTNFHVSQQTSQSPTINKDKPVESKIKNAPEHNTAEVAQHLTNEQIEIRHKAAGVIKVSRDDKNTLLEHKHIFKRPHIYVETKQNAEPEITVDLLFESPLSPCQEVPTESPKIIPLERYSGDLKCDDGNCQEEQEEACTRENTIDSKKQPHFWASSLFENSKLNALIEEKLEQYLQFYKSRRVTEDVINFFSEIAPELTVKGIIKLLLRYKHEDISYRKCGPLLSTSQSVMFNLMMELEDGGVKDIMDIFLDGTEKIMFWLNNIKQLEPYARLHVAVCYKQLYYTRMRIVLCRALTLMDDDVVIPYIYLVIRSWPKIVPKLDDTELKPCDELEVRAFVELIKLKQCKTEFSKRCFCNLLALLCSSLYGFLHDKEDLTEILHKLFAAFLKEDASKGITHLILAISKSINKSILYKAINELKSKLETTTNVTTISPVIRLIGMITSLFSLREDASDFVNNNREFVRKYTADTYPDPVRELAEDILVNLVDT